MVYGKKGDTGWSTIRTIILTLVLILLFTSILNAYFTTPLKTLTACETNGAKCQLTCDWTTEQRLPFSCQGSDTGDICCSDPNAPKGPLPTGSNVGTITDPYKDDHRMYIFGEDGKSVTNDPLTLDSDDLDKTFSYYMAAEGDEVGVCYFTLFRKKPGGSNEVVIQGGEVRVRMDRDDCLLTAKNREPLEFTLAGAEDEDYIYSLQAIIFPKEWGETVEEFMEFSEDNDPWGSPGSWVGVYVKLFNLPISCSALATKDACYQREDCLYCESSPSVNCFSRNGYDDDLDLACERECPSNPFKSRLFGDFKTCVPENWADNYCNDPNDKDPDLSYQGLGGGGAGNYSTYSISCVDQGNKFSTDPFNQALPNYCGCRSLFFYFFQDIGGGGCPSADSIIAGAHYDYTFSTAGVGTTAIDLKTSYSIDQLKVDNYNRYIVLRGLPNVKMCVAAYHNSHRDKIAGVSAANVLEIPVYIS